MGMRVSESLDELGGAKEKRKGLTKIDGSEETSEEDRFSVSVKRGREGGACGLEGWIIRIRVRFQ